METPRLGGHLPGISFIVRLWLEERERPGELSWQFQVVHVQSGERHNYGRVSEVLAFVERRAGLPVPVGSAAPERHLGEPQA